MPTYVGMYNGSVTNPVSNSGITGVCYGDGYLWLAYAINTGPVNSLIIYKCDPATGRVINSVTTAMASSGINRVILGYNAGALFFVVWVNLVGVYLGKIATATFPAGLSMSGVLLGLGIPVVDKMAFTPDGNAWCNINGIQRFDPATLTLVASIAGTAGAGGGVTYDSVNGFIWGAGGPALTTTIWKIDPATNLIADSIVEPAAAYQDVEYAFGSLWACTGAVPAGAFYRYNPVTKAVEAKVGPSSLGGPSMISSDSIRIGGMFSTGTQLVIVDPTLNTVAQPGVEGPGPTIFPASGNNPGLVGFAGYTGGVGFTGGNTNTRNPAWGTVSTSLRRSRKRGGEFWGIVPEVSDYLG